MSQQGKLNQSTLDSLTGNTGGVVTADSLGNINVIGSGSITVSGNPATNTLTISSSGTVATSFVSNTGTAVPLANVLNVLGDNTQGINITGTGNTLSVLGIDSTTSQKGVVLLATSAQTIAGILSTVVNTPDSLKDKLGTQTLRGIPYGNTTTGALQWTSALGNGQLIIGATGSNPGVGSLTSSGSTIAISTGANTINLEVAATVATTYNADSGSATPALNALSIVGSGTVSTSATGSTVTITGSGGGGFMWSEVTGTSQALVKDNGYIANNAGLVTFTLPATAALGDTFKIVGKGAGLFKVAQNAGQSIRISTSTTSTGVGGSITSTDDADSIEIVCTTANTGFIVSAMIGNYTVV